MTPEQLQQYIDAALKQRDQFSLVFYPVVTVFSIGGAWLLSYVREKGKNLATKEDVTVLTNTVEAIKADLGARQHYSRVRYERELKVYEELWPRLCNLQAAVLSLRPVFDWGPVKGVSEEEEKQNRRKRFLEAHGSFLQAVSLARPFYSSDIWERLQQLVKLCWGEAVDWGLFSDPRGREGRGDYWETAQKNSEAINSQIDVICEAIRTRLSHFDNV